MKTKSIWGKPPTRLYKLIRLMETNFISSFDTCVVGCSDGKFALPFARKGYKVDGFDIDEVALNGGVKTIPVRDVKGCISLKESLIDGFINRVYIERLTSFVLIKLLDFYFNPPKKFYDLVFTSCSIHYSHNQKLSLKEKVDKLKGIVKIHGYLYIDYMMAIDEKDKQRYLPSRFFIKGEMKKYFDGNWEILSLRENSKQTLELAHVDCVYDHFHKFGYVLARRLK